MEPWQHRVQYYETDCMGVVHHSNYIRWFEEARVQLLIEAGLPYHTLEKMGISSPVIGVQSRYRRPARFGDEVLLVARIVEFTGSRFRVSYQVSNKESGLLLCHGSSEHCFISPEGRPVSLKRENAAMYQRLLELVEADYGA